MSKRNLFDELNQGLEEARKHDQGKLTLRSMSVEIKPVDCGYYPKRDYSYQGISEVVAGSFRRLSSYT